MKKILGILFLSLFTSPAIAQTDVYLGPSRVTIQETEKLGAVAEIVFENNLRNDEKRDEKIFPLTLDNLSVFVEFQFNTKIILGEDTIVVTVPEGYMCEPFNCILEVPEMYTRKLFIFPLESMGM